jgi:parallel beta-helix repeat protein
MKLSLSMLFCLLLVGSAISAGLIDISYSPYTISQPGSYILVADLHTPQDLDCITIATSNVTIDLNGHTLFGAGTAVGTNGGGIYAGYNNNLTIKNGIVRDFRAHGIYIVGGDNKIMHVQAYGNGHDGIANYNNNAVIQDCCSEYNLGNGIIGSNGSVIINNTVRGNGIIGILTGGGCIINGNSLYYNTGHGIYAVGEGCIVKDNAAYGNGGDGINTGYANTVIGNSAYLNAGNGIYIDNGSTAKDNTAHSNTFTGIYASSGCTIIGNTLYSNSSSGLKVTNGCQVINNNSRNNLYAGIQVTGAENSVSQNMCTSNYAYGLLSIGGSYFEQNKLRSNGTNKSLSTSTEGTGDLANVIIP